MQNLLIELDKVPSMIYTTFMNYPFHIMMMLLGLALIEYGVRELKKQYM